MDYFFQRSIIFYEKQFVKNRFAFVAIIIFRNKWIGLWCHFCNKHKNTLYPESHDTRSGKESSLFLIIVTFLKNVHFTRHNRRIFEKLNTSGLSVLRFVMDSIWFSVDDCYGIEDDSTTSHLGVFNQEPSEISSWLSRPEAPFFVPSSAPCTFGSEEKQQEFGFVASPQSMYSSFSSRRELSVF